MEWKVEKVSFFLIFMFIVLCIFKKIIFILVVFIIKVNFNIYNKVESSELSDCEFIILWIIN